MPRKCSVIGCRSNYDSTAERVTIYRFPRKYEDLLLWIDSLPNKFDPSAITDNMGVCSKHFPLDVPMERRGAHMIPTRPPSVFYNLPQTSDSKTKHTVASGYYYNVPPMTSVSNYDEANLPGYGEDDILNRCPSMKGLMVKTLADLQRHKVCCSDILGRFTLRTRTRLNHNMLAKSF